MVRTQPFWRLRGGRGIAQTRCWSGAYLREMSRNATGAIALSTEPSSMVCALLSGAHLLDVPAKCRVKAEV